jgi:RimJ/RimL family protein N-acetyltransferase
MEFPKPQPHLVGYADGLALYFEGRQLFSTRIFELVREDPRRFKDIVSPGHDVMKRAGWRYANGAACFTAQQGDRIVAVASAARIVAREYRNGCNLGYAVTRQFEGRGLAKLLVAHAYIALYSEHPDIDFVQVQTRSDNRRSLALASSLGLSEEATAGFVVSRPEGQELSYAIYRAKALAFFQTAAAIVSRCTCESGDESGGRTEYRQTSPRIFASSVR